MSGTNVTNSDSTTIWVSPSGNAKITIERGYFHVNVKYLRLTKKELSLFGFIIVGNGKVKTKQMMLEHLYGTQNQPDQKIIDVFVCKIRGKLKKQHVEAALAIQTIWGRGYALATNEAGPYTHWVPNVKADILDALDSKEKTPEQILAEHPDLSAEELAEWQQQWKIHRALGLRVTRTQKYLRN